MAKYKVDFYQSVTTIDRQSMIIEADSPEQARQKVDTWGNTGLGLTQEEENSGKTEKEGEVTKTEFYGVGRKDEVYLQDDSSSTQELTGTLLQRFIG